MKLAGMALVTAMSLAVTLSGAWSGGKCEDVDVSWSSPRRFGEASAPILNVSFLVDGAPVSLRLVRNDGLVAPRAMHKFYAANGSILEGPLEAPQCFYTGGVEGDPLGRAGISTCGGAFSGFVVAHGRALGITPASAGTDVALASQGSSRHVLVALEDMDVLSFEVGISDFVRRRLESVDKAPGRARRLREKLRGRNLTVELAMVNGAARFESFRAFGGQTAMTSNTLEVINGAAAIYAGAKGFKLSLALVLVGQETFEKDPWTVARVEDNGRLEAADLYMNFSYWSSFRSTHRYHHVLLTGFSFRRWVTGTAALAGMCRLFFPLL